MTRPPLAFAIPGDIATLTGGYVYERRLLEGLRQAGHDVQHLELPAGFPDPSDLDMALTVEALEQVPPGRPVILDGLVFGSIDTAGLARMRAPVVAMIHHPLAHETGLTADRRGHLLRTERDNLRLARHVLVPSPHTCRILIRDYAAPPGAVSVIRPGTDRPRLLPRPQQPPLILSVGILHPRKGHAVLIEALSQLADLDWQAVIVGNPWDRDHAEALARQCRASPVADRITLAGRVSDDALQDLYARAQVFALATHYEGHGIVLDEALVRGLPIVSCAAGAVPDTVPPGAGLLVPPGDPDAFAGALRRVLADPGRRDRMAAAARATGERLPDWQQMADRASLVLTGLFGR